VLGVCGFGVLCRIQHGGRDVFCKTATGLNLGITVIHLFLQFKFYSRELDGEVVVELSPELQALQSEKEKAIVGDAQRQYDVAMNLLGRATATHTSTQGSRPHYDAAFELLGHAWRENQSFQAQYQLAQIFEGRYVEAWKDKKEALNHYRELLKYFNGRAYRSLDKGVKKSNEKIEKAVRKRIE
jgi:tetratricopeptide (TPR) repeat protein